jgi:membrane protease subunit HflK
LVTEYQKAPQVMRDRMYIDAMQQIYTNTTKVLIDTKAGSNLLYLPLEKIIQQAGQSNAPVSTQPAQPLTESTGNPLSSTAPVDARSRDGRSRDRDSR